MTRESDTDPETLLKFVQEEIVLPAVESICSDFDCTLEETGGPIASSGGTVQIEMDALDTDLFTGEIDPVTLTRFRSINTNRRLSTVESQSSTVSMRPTLKRQARIADQIPVVSEPSVAEEDKRGHLSTVAECRGLLMRRNDLGHWEPLNHSGQATVVVQHEPFNPLRRLSNATGYSITAFHNAEILLRCPMNTDFHYMRTANPLFVHWQSDGQRFGLTFDSMTTALRFNAALEGVISELRRLKYTTVLISSFDDGDLPEDSYKNDSPVSSIRLRPSSPHGSSTFGSRLTSRRTSLLPQSTTNGSTLGAMGNLTAKQRQSAFRRANSLPQTFLFPAPNN